MSVLSAELRHQARRYMARLKAREFVARWYRETGEAPDFTIFDRMKFAYEHGYMRGQIDGANEGT